MKLVKSLLLSSAAGVAAVASAQAADLPFRKAAPVEYVRVCDYTGAGFFYIPGSDTCLKIDGYAQGNFAYVEPKRQFFPGNTPNYAVGKNPFVGPNTANGTIIQKHTLDQTGFKTEGRVNFDARTQTAYGTLRGYVRFNADAAGGIYNGNPAGSSISNPNTTASATNTAQIDKAFIQFAGFTAGRVQSFFDFYADNYNYEAVANSDTSQEVFAYTATFGGGFSATIAAEDATIRRNGIKNSLDTVLTGTTVGGITTYGNTAVNYGGEEIPDFVAAIRVDQAWGAAQLSAAYHQVRTNESFSSTDILGNVLGGDSETTRDKNGFAVQAGIQIKLPMLAAGDDFWLQADYQNGAFLYQDTTGGFNKGVNSGFLGGFQHQDADAVAIRNANGTYSLSLSKGYSIAGAFHHFFTPNFSDVVFGSYEHVSYGAAGNIDWTVGGLGKADEYRIGNQFLWTPVNNLVVGLEVIYAHIDQTLAHNPGSLATALPVGISQNPSAFEGRLRMERDF